MMKKKLQYPTKFGRLLIQDSTSDDDDEEDQTDDTATNQPTVATVKDRTDDESPSDSEDEVLKKG